MERVGKVVWWSLTGASKSHLRRILRVSGGRECQWLYILGFDSLLMDRFQRSSP
jgi:hypothetical protein